MKHNLLTIKSEGSLLRLMAINSIRIYLLYVLYLLITNVNISWQIWGSGNTALLFTAAFALSGNAFEGRSPQAPRQG